MKEKQVLDTDNMEPGKVDNSPGGKEKPKTVPNKFGDNQFFGPWYTYKTTHSIMIHGTPKESVP